MIKNELEQNMMEYSIEEIKMAEKYIHLAKECSDQSLAVKLQEIAKDEMRHYDFLKQTLDTKLSATPDGKTMKGELLEKVYDNWICKVKNKVDTFKFK